MDDGCGGTRRIKLGMNKRGSLKVAPVTEKKRSNRLSWYGHVIRSESNITKIMMSMNVYGHPGRDRPTKRWMDCVKGDISSIKAVSMEMTNDTRERKKKTCCADST
jgi:hypothetical protein